MRRFLSHVLLLVLRLFALKQWRKEEICDCLRRNFHRFVSLLHTYKHFFFHFQPAVGILFYVLDWLRKTAFAQWREQLVTIHKIAIYKFSFTLEMFCKMKYINFYLHEHAAAIPSYQEFIYFSHYSKAFVRELFLDVPPLCA